MVDGAETACESVGQGTFAAQVGVEAGASPRVVVYKGGDDEALVDCVLDLPSKRVGRADFGSVEGGSWTQLRCCERTRLLRVRGALCFDGFAPSI